MNGRTPVADAQADRPEGPSADLPDAVGDVRPALSPAQLAFLAFIAALVITRIRRLRRRRQA
jgi:hypothetical protein